MSDDKQQELVLAELAAQVLAEMAAMREDMRVLSAVVQRHEQKLVSLRDEFRVLRDEFSDLRMEFRNMRTDIRFKYPLLNQDRRTLVEGR